MLVWTAEIWPSATAEDIRDINERVYLATHEAVEGGYVPLSPLCGGFGLGEFNPRPGACRHCGGGGRALYFGSGPTADLIACPVCADGRKLEDTDIPTVRRRRSGVRGLDGSEPLRSISYEPSIEDGGA